MESSKRLRKSTQVVYLTCVPRQNFEGKEEKTSLKQSTQLMYLTYVPRGKTLKKRKKDYTKRKYTTWCTNRVPICVQETKEYWNESLLTRLRYITHVPTRVLKERRNRPHLIDV